MSNEIGYWYPNLKDDSEANSKKKFEDGFISLAEAKKNSKATTERAEKRDIVERGGVYLTDDGRQLLT